MTAPVPGAAVLPVTPLCPFCGSDQVTTTSKSISETTYWRCQGCGEIWNQARLLSFRARRRPY